MTPQFLGAKFQKSKRGAIAQNPLRLVGKTENPRLAPFASVAWSEVGAPASLAVLGSSGEADGGPAAPACRLAKPAGSRLLSLGAHTEAVQPQAGS